MGTKKKLSRFWKKSDKEDQKKFEEKAEEFKKEFETLCKLYNVILVAKLRVTSAGIAPFLEVNKVEEKGADYAIKE